MLTAKLKRSLTAIAVITLAVPALAAEKEDQTLPRMIVIQTEVDKHDNESVAKFYTIDMQKQVVDENTAMEANQLIEQSEGHDINLDAEDRDCPEMVTMLKNLMGNIADPESEQWQRFRWGFSFGLGRYHFFGYGRRGHYGYGHYQPWRRANYGFYWNNRLWPYYGSSYYFYRQPYRYYYYYNPYYRW